MTRSGILVFVTFVALRLPMAGYAQSPAVPKDAITIVGNIDKPGLYQAATVLAALKQAGGPAKTGVLMGFIPSTVYIYRTDDQGAKHEIPVSLSDILKHRKPDAMLYPGDILFVPNQKNAKPQPLRDPLNLAGSSGFDLGG